MKLPAHLERDLHTTLRRVRTRTRFGRAVLPFASARMFAGSDTAHAFIVIGRLADPWRAVGVAPPPALFLAYAPGGFVVDASQQPVVEHMFARFLVGLDVAAATMQAFQPFAADVQSMRDAMASQHPRRRPSWENGMADDMDDDGLLTAG